MTDLSRVAALEREFDLYYSEYDPHTQPLVDMLENMYAEHKDEPSCQLKARMITLLAEHCPVHLFRHSPFFHEISSGRDRHTWGGLQSHVGSFLHEKTSEQWLKPYAKDTEHLREQAYIHAWDNPVGFDHFCLGYDNILAQGFEGILARAQAALETAQTDRKRSFLAASVQVCRAIMRLADRFAEEARRLAADASDEEERAHYLRIAQAASHVPAKPPRTFYEALCAVVFCRECIGSLEGIGVSTFGHLDRMLAPYCEADIAAGRITKDDIKMLFHALLTYTDTRFEAKTQYNETSTTIILGGCDRDGRVVYNDVTRCILDTLLEGRYISTKINCRISNAHPAEYFERIAYIQTSDLSVIVMQNDDVIVPARVRLGQAVEDARLHASGGCHEIVLANTEVNTRADTWISLPRILLDTLKQSTAETWEDFYTQSLSDIRDFIEHIVATKNKYEARWYEFDPLPLCSSTLTGPIEQGKDLTEGGAKYSSTALSMLGMATYVDSLYAVKHLVYDTKQLTCAQYSAMVESDFDGQERLRQYILHRLPKCGTNDPELNAFTAKVLDALSGFAGQKNARGGDYLPAFYPHDIFRYLGAMTGATPDGRRAGAPMSRGCSPSEFIEVKSPLDLISGLSAIDFTAYADSFCAELTLPRMKPEVGIPVFTAIIREFLKNSGSSLQFNLIDRDLLLEAQRDPENHADIIVRVCGYSAVFVTLSKEQQDEVIGRAVR